MVILIVGSKYGSPVSSSDVERDYEDQYQFYKSITEEEVSRAAEEGVPTYVFVNNKVLTEYDTYLRNRDNSEVTYAHADNIAVFKLVDSLRSLGRYTHGFSTSEDITDWLRSQWAGEFQNHLVKLRSEKGQNKIESSISELEETLKRLSVISETLVTHLSSNDPSLVEKIEQEKESSVGRLVDIKLKEISYNSHLLYRHNFDLETIKTAHRSSDTFKVFLAKLREAHPEISCGYIKSESPSFYYIEEVNRSRDLMGLALFRDDEDD